MTVQRHPEDVFEAATLASFEGKPVTDGHPPENVGPENYSAYTKGHVQNVRRSGEYIVADLYQRRQPGGGSRNNVKREVSCRYLCSYVPDGPDTGRATFAAITWPSCRKSRAGPRLQYKTPPGGGERWKQTHERILEVCPHAFGNGGEGTPAGRAGQDGGDCCHRAGLSPPKGAGGAPAEEKPAEDAGDHRGPEGGDDIGSSWTASLRCWRPRAAAARRAPASRRERH